MAAATTALKGALTQLVKVTPAFAHVIGTTETTRGDITKRVWAYIKEHKLQDETVKTNIKADSALKEVVGVDSFAQSQLLKLIQPHIIKTAKEAKAAPLA